jgi:hypothetical protein
VFEGISTSPPDTVNFLPATVNSAMNFFLQVLQDKYQGLIGEEFIADFVNYGNVLFENFGDRIRDWMTFNEPWVTCVLQVGFRGLAGFGG